MGPDIDKETEKYEHRAILSKLLASCLANLWFLIGEKGNEEILVLILLENVCIGSGGAVWV